LVNNYRQAHLAVTVLGSYFPASGHHARNSMYFIQGQPYR